MGISREQALDCLQSDDLIGVGMEADAVRRSLHPEGVVSYAIERKMDCSIVTSSLRADDASLSRLCDEITETVEQGSTGVCLVSESGFDACGIGGVENVLRSVRKSFPALWIEGLSAAEIVALAAGSGPGVSETIARLHGAGMDAIAGEKVAQPRCNMDEWLAVHRAAHGLGMQTVAAMLPVVEEASASLIDSLQAVRRLQQETGGFVAFVPQCFPSRNATGGWDEPTAVEQMKTLAVARIFLDNIENVQVSAAVQNLKVLQMGLRFGANDVGSITPDPSKLSHTSEEDLRRIIRDAGFRPVQRDSIYRTMFLD